MHTNQPRVSIGLPVFNGERYLEEALRSIVSQTYADFELVICDNASTDRTEDICRSYAAVDRRFRYYRNDRNIGLARNLARVFELSTGEYFQASAHDDIAAPEYIRRCVEVLDRDLEVVVCFPRATLIDENGEFVGNYDPKPDTSSLRPHERFRNLILAPDRAVQAMGLMRSHVIRKTEFSGSYPGSDEVFLADMALRGKFFELPERLLTVRLHPGQSTQGVLGSERVRVAYYDTSLARKIVPIKILYLAGLLRAIRDAPLTRRERLYCYLHTVRWFFVPAHFRSMVKDVLLVTRIIKP